MDVFKELMVREPGLLARPIEELAPISFVGAAAVSAYRSIVSKLADLPMTEKQKAKTLRDGQDAGEMLLAIETRIGELLPVDGRAAGTHLQDDSGKFEGSEQVYPQVFGETNQQRYKKAQTARTIANNPEAVAAVIEEAKANEDIPTKTAVVNLVRAHAEHKRRKEAEGKPKPSLVMTLEQTKYINTLEGVIEDLPKLPPKDWTDKAFTHARGLWRIIFSRGELFNESSRGSISE